MTSVRTWIVTLAAVIAVVSGFACDDVPDEALQSCEASQVYAGHVATDILFVVDESGSMSQENAALQAALGDFITTLSSSPVRNDFQIGVTTTAVDGTGSGPDGSFIGAGIMPGSSPTLVADFQATIQSITAPAGFWQEQPFEAMKLAIQKSAAGQPNAGFIRPGARLAIFFTSDEDDCSVSPPPGTSSSACVAAKTAGTLNPVSGYVDFLKAPIEGEVRDVVVYAVAGFSQTDLVLSCGASQCTDQSCSTAADKGDRFLALAQAFGASGRIGSICSPTLSGVLQEFAGAIMSNEMPLEGAPADPALLVVTVTKSTGEVVACGEVATIGTPEAATANVVYSPPQGGRPASLSFQFDCALEAGDRIDLDVVCAG